MKSTFKTIFVGLFFSLLSAQAADDPVALEGPPSLGPSSGALVLVGEAEGYRAALVPLVERAREGGAARGTRNIFAGDLAAHQQYYEYLRWRTRYASGGSLMLVGGHTSFDQLEPQARAVIVLDHLWAQILVPSLTGSPALPNSPYVDLLEGSDAERGSFQPKRRVWQSGSAGQSRVGELPTWRYFSRPHPDTGERVYRLASCGDGHGDGQSEVIEVTAVSSPVGGYGLGHLTYIPPLPHHITSNGFILDRAGRLIRDPGFFVYHSGRGNVACSAYDYDYTSGAMALYCLGGCPSTPQPGEEAITPCLRYMIATAGGFDRLSRETVLFLPHRSAEEVTRSVSQAGALLPLLYLLQESAEGDGGGSASGGGGGSSGGEEDALDHDALALVIAGTERVIVDGTYHAIAAVVEAEVRSEMTAEALAEQGAPAAAGGAADAATERDASSLGGAGAAADSAPPPPSARGERGRGEEKKEKRKTRVAPAPTPRQPPKPKLDPDEVKRKARAKVLEKIRENFRRKAAEQRHFDSRAAGELLGQLRRALSRENVQRLDGVRTRGSHTATAVTTAGGHSVYLSLVRRTQSDGFSSGTVKAIVDDWVNRSIAAILGEARART